MTEVINLNQKRKIKMRLEKETTASRNRIKFGRTKEEKNTEKLKAKRAEQSLEGHKIEPERDE
jgi:hypothetical protein